MKVRGMVSLGLNIAVASLEKVSLPMLFLIYHETPGRG